MEHFNKKKKYKTKPKKPNQTTHFNPYTKGTPTFLAHFELFLLQTLLTRVQRDYTSPNILKVKKDL